MSIQEQKITDAAIAANGVQSRPDKLTGTAAQNKKVFDALVTAVVREKFNAMIDELTGTTAAAQLGITTIPGFSAGNIQTALEQIVQAMQDVTQGSVADGSITLAKLAAEVTAVALGGAAASHTHGAGDINSGVLDAARLPVLDGTKLGAGSVGTAQLGAAVVTSDKLAALSVLATHIAQGAVTAQKIAPGAVQTANIGDGVVTREKLAASARGNASSDLSSTPFSVGNNGRLLVFSSSENASYTLTQSLWNSLPAGFSVTIVKASGADSGALTINWTSMAGVWDFTRGTVFYNETKSLKLVRRGDMVTFEKWGETNRLLISGNFNTPNFFAGTSDSPPSSWQPGDVYLKYE